MRKASRDSIKNTTRLSKKLEFLRMEEIEEENDTTKVDNKLNQSLFVDKEFTIKDLKTPKNKDMTLKDRKKVFWRKN